MSYTGPTNPNPGEFPLTLYGYSPNLGFSIFACLAWGFVLAPHLYWAGVKKSKVIEGLIVLGCLWELSGYAIRAASDYSPFSPDLFIAQYSILHTAPIFFISALVYALGWGIRGKENHTGYRRFRRASLFPALQTLNFITFVLVLVGSAMYGVALKREVEGREVGYSRSAARNVLIAGQALMLASLIATLAILTDLLLHRKTDDVHSHPPITDTAPGPTGPTGDSDVLSEAATPIALHTALSHTAESIAATSPTAAHPAPAPGPSTKLPILTGRAITMLFLALAWLTAGMLHMRTAYRLAETVRGTSDPAWTSQVLFGLFEFGITWTVIVVWTAWPFQTQLTPGITLLRRTWKDKGGKKEGYAEDEHTRV